MPPRKHVLHSRPHRQPSLLLLWSSAFHTHAGACVSISAAGRAPGCRMGSRVWQHIECPQATPSEDARCEPQQAVIESWRRQAASPQPLSPAAAAPLLLPPPLCPAASWCAAKPNPTPAWHYTAVTTATTTVMSSILPPRGNSRCSHVACVHVCGAGRAQAGQGAELGQRSTSSKLRKLTRYVCAQVLTLGWFASSTAQGERNDGSCACRNAVLASVAASC